MSFLNLQLLSFKYQLVWNGNWLVFISHTHTLNTQSVRESPTVEAQRLVSNCLLIKYRWINLPLRFIYSIKYFFIIDLIFVQEEFLLHACKEMRSGTNNKTISFLRSLYIFIWFFGFCQEGIKKVFPSLHTHTHTDCHALFNDINFLCRILTGGATLEKAFPNNHNRKKIKFQFERAGESVKSK